MEQNISPKLHRLQGQMRTYKLIKFAFEQIGPVVFLTYLVVRGVWLRTKGFYVYDLTILIAFFGGPAVFFLHNRFPRIFQQSAHAVAVEALKTGTYELPQVKVLLEALYKIPISEQSRHYLATALRNLGKNDLRKLKPYLPVMHRVICHYPSNNFVHVFYSVLYVLEYLGTIQTVNILQRLVKNPPKDDFEERIQEAANCCAKFIEARLKASDNSSKLLRRSSISNDTFLRPASAQDTTPADQLLRPAENDETLPSA